MCIRDGLVGGYLFVADSQEIADKAFVHRIDVYTGAETTLAFDTPGAETGATDLAVSGPDTIFVTTGNSAAGTNPLHVIQNSTSATPIVVTRSVPVGSGPGGTIAANTRLTNAQFDGEV